MKKILSLLVAVTLLFCFSPSVFAANAESENTPVSDLLLPYIEVIEEVNEETGSQIYIPAGKEEDVYNYYKDYSLEEFKQSLLNDINDYNTALSSSQDMTVVDIGYSSGVLSRNEVQPRAMVEDVVQVAPIGYNTSVYLYATVIGGGNPITYKYKTIIDVDVKWPDDYTGFHFAVSSGYYSVSSDRKSCTVTLTGSPMNAAGLVQTVVKTYTVTFTAG